MSSSSYYDPYTSNYTKDVNTSAFLTALCANVVIFVVLIGCYEVFQRWFPTVYSPRSVGVIPPEVRPKNISSTRNPSSQTTPSSSSSSAPAINVNTRSPLGWVPGVVRASWSVVRTVGGLDSYMFLQYVRLCFRISSRDIRWLQTLYVAFLMSEEYRHYLECRVDFLARGEGNVLCQQHMYSLMVERIPHELRSDGALFDYFSRLFPRKVHSTAVVLNLPDLEREVGRRRRVLRRLEKSMVSLEVRGRRPRHVVGRKRLRCCGIETSPIFASFG
jgi:hypothetical protein